MSLLRVEVHTADDGACGWYRLGWPAAAVEIGGLAEVEVLMPNTDNPPFLPTYWDSRRVVGLRPREWPDVLVLQRPLRATLAQTIPLLQEAGVAVVVEIDDDFSAVTPRNGGWSPSIPEKVRALDECCRLADMVTTSTPALAERFAPHGRVRVLPNRLPSWYFLVDKAPHADLRVGWSGSVTVHRDDLPVVGNGIAAALRGTDASVHVIGKEDGVARGLGVAKVSSTGWLPLSEYPVAVAALDVGLAPLEDTVFNRSKSWLKPLEYAALGVPCIGSPRREYLRLAAEYPGSVQLADHPAKWRDHVRHLLLDKDWRQERVRTARDAVRGCTIEAHREDWASAWQDARNYYTKGHS